LAAGQETKVRRLNWGCGSWAEPGWINSDISESPGVDIVCDIREGLPLEDESIEYAVSIHALPEIPYPQLLPTLQELRRVLEPGGILRLALPDIEKGFEAYRNGDRDYFLVPDDEWSSMGAKFIVQMIWYGYSRTLFTYEFAEELLQKAGFSSVARCDFKQTHGPYPDIVQLDNRERESLFVEAVR
jgi:predicted SAM-dependent methyltransferase